MADWCGKIRIKPVTVEILKYKKFSLYWTVFPMKRIFILKDEEV